jgi:hypothetical protein
MASTYVNNLRLNEMATGDGSGTWGTTTNTNLELIGQALGYGTRAIADASTDNITIADGASDSDRAMYLKLTGGGQACTVSLLPNTASKVWMMENATSYTLTFTCGSGANVAILAGETKIIATDGAGSGGVVYDVLTDTNLAGTTKTAALTNAGALSNQGTVTVGVDDTGYDVKLFGATSGNYMLWDESADSLLVNGDIDMVTNGNRIDLDTDNDTSIRASADDTITIEVGGSDLIALTTTSTFSCPLTVGVDDTGHDVKFFGATASAYMLWDESADDLILAGAARVVVPASGLVIASTAVTTTAAELNLLDAITRGSIIYGNASGASARLAVGSNGQALTTDGTDISWGSAGATSLDGLSDAKSAGTNFANSLLLGHETTGTLSSASNNVAVGIGAMDAITSGTDSVFIGFNAGTAFTSGNESIGIGSQALLAATTAEDNIAIGCKALKSVTTGGGNMAMGLLAGEDITTGTQNILFGYLCGLNITTGTNNIAIGGNALDVCTTASENLAIGKDSLGLSTSGTNNVAVGNYTGDAITTGHSNTMLGIYAGSAITEGDYHVAIGRNALDACTTADNNVAVGWTSLGATTTGASNTAVGGDSMAANTTGLLNVAVGTATLDANTSGERNTALGIQALGVNTTGGYNTACGERALDANTTASNNSALGSEALGACTEGHSNTAAGFQAGFAITTGDNNIMIGYQAGISGSPGGAISTANNILSLGDENIATANIQVDWTVASDKRDKTDVESLNMGLDFINKLEPVTYRWDKRSKYSDDQSVTPDGAHKEEQLDVGFLAQDVEALEKEYGYDFDNKTNLTTQLSEDNQMYGLKYSKFVPMLVKSIQELTTQVETLKQEVETLKGE